MRALCSLGHAVPRFVGRLVVADRITHGKGRRAGHPRQTVTGFWITARSTLYRGVMKPVEATPDLREFLHSPENAAFLEFYEYWLAKGAGKGMPARADIDPLDIPQLLANVFLDRRRRGQSATVPLSPGAARGSLSWKAR